LRYAAPGLDTEGPKWGPERRGRKGPPSELRSWGCVNAPVYFGDAGGDVVQQMTACLTAASDRAGEAKARTAGFEGQIQ
jgi:hypothetical protein